MKESSWNKVIWQAMESIKHFNIDETFRYCEKRLHFLKAPEREMSLRLLALALYCDKAHSSHFFKSAIFPRFAEVFDLFRFDSIVKNLIKENSPALVVFWVIFRLSSGKFVSRNNYLQLENEMRCKSLDMAMDKVI